MVLKIFLFTAFAIGKSLQLKYDNESLKRKYWQEKQFIVWMSLDFFPLSCYPELLVLFPVTEANCGLKEVFNSLL